MAGVSATTLGVSLAEGSAPAKKNALKAVGCLWLVAAAMDGYYVSQGTAVSPSHEVVANREGWCA